MTVMKIYEKIIYINQWTYDEDILKVKQTLKGLSINSFQRFNAAPPTNRDLGLTETK